MPDHGLEFVDIYKYRIELQASKHNSSCTCNICKKEFPFEHIEKQKEYIEFKNKMEY